MLLNQINPHGGDIYHNDVLMDFSSNVNPWGVHPHIKLAVAKAVDNADRYPDPYCSELRKKLEEREGIGRENILCGNGAADLIYSFAAALDGNKPSVIPIPTFCEYETAMNAAGKPFVNNADKGLENYEAIFLCSPNNPTGALIPPEGIEKIAATGIRVLLDVTFLPLTETPFLYNFPALLSRYPNIVALKAFTKDFALAGVRLGYAISTDRIFLNKMAEKSQCWNVSTLAQTAGLAALECSGDIKAQINTLLSERKRVTEELKKIPGLKVYDSATNFILLYSEKDLYGKLKERRILIRDCSYEKGLQKGFVRIAVRTREENDTLIAAIKEIRR
ncbi:MAG: aminotransferase class I/II-fold pyridoxal phosphate-dependent enzyme [Clostridia bacterium]|nr:aminotransferase class I/II-fold pyridoxal phosphate-dependent enzyme [Clostridia bacterium]